MYVPKSPAFPRSIARAPPEWRCNDAPPTLSRALPWVAFGLVCLPGGRAKADISVDNVKELIRVATCADVRAVVAAAGLAKTEAIARAAGATEEQIADACVDRCNGCTSAAERDGPAEGEMAGCAA